MPDTLLALLKGFGLGGSLIVAIGAQNAFLLTNALKKNHALSIAFTCALVDAVLITVGVWGLGAFIEREPGLLLFITLAGCVFLLVYGAIALRRAFTPSHLDTTTSNHAASRSAAIATTLALSLLNPHVYLDTVLLLGSIGGQLSGRGPTFFTIGAVTASFAWFFSLALAGKWLAPVLSSDKHWRRLDMLIAIVMWVIAFSLAMSAYRQLS